MQVLNSQAKEQLVIKLHQEGKTIREIASVAHLSFTDISSIIRRIDGKVDDGVDLKNKSPETKALSLFSSGKKPIDVAIELNLSASEVQNILEEFWVLNEMDELALVYLEIKNHLTLFLRLFHIMKKNRLINQKDIQIVLRYAAFDLPSLENRIQRSTSDVIDMEWKKKRLVDEVIRLNSYLSQLKKLLKRHRVLSHYVDLIYTLTVMFYTTPYTYLCLEKH
ncbi:MAG: hypothetical protein GEU26_11740 [Nitrososphaeraceae archaeon]|nr:hypothetical protein [Nitrososphaeraceae archaeon]